MPAETTFRLRRVWLQIHLWPGIGLAVLLVPLSLSGAALVWHDHLDALISPGRYAATAGAPLPPSQLVQRAAAALEPGFQPMAVRMPEGAGWPATVTAREARRGEGGRPRLVTVYLDPPSGRVLDVSEFRNSLIGFLHRFHENLTIPEWSGRAIVGWNGVAMLILALTGITLWWPRNASVRRGLRWSRGPTVTGLLIWLRKRNAKRTFEPKISDVPQVEAAE
ncbi:MAG: PepSY domain-containing protein [Xanthobacteraceae bacterium]|nr:PepSY domain-containing protein [Xanthobacteraceae bacterium]